MDIEKEYVKICYCYTGAYVDIAIRSLKCIFRYADDKQLLSTVDLAKPLSGIRYCSAVLYLVRPQEKIVTSFFRMAEDFCDKATKFANFQWYTGNGFTTRKNIVTKM